ncbi:MAG: hypothetical protein ACI9OJ_003817, partial [Myxococcota bacterium]
EWLEQYLQLPTLDPRVRTLAADITRDHTNDYDKARAIERYLLANYTYSLAGGHGEKDPLADFLFDNTSGHCEYFSSAFVILARAANIAARPAGGFYGGVYNSSGDYIALRQADAHSWAEVYIPNHDWVVFDPTPASGALIAPDDGFFAKVGRYIDSLQLLWYKWVIRWDLDAQIDFLRGVGKKLQGLGDFLPSGKGGLGKAMGNLRDAITPLRIAIALGMVVLVGLWWFRRRRLGPAKGAENSARRVANSRDAKVARRVYESLVKVAERRGVTVTDSTSPGRLLAALRADSPYSAEVAGPVIRFYEDIVFGGRTLDKSALELAKQNVRMLRRAGQ